MRPAASPLDRSNRLLQNRIRNLFRHLPLALSGEEEAVHQMRVASRRLRIALPLLARVPHSRRLRRSRSTLHDVTRVAGTSRDLDVSVSLLDERIRAQGTAGPQLAALRRRLLAARRRCRARLADSLLDIEIARLRRDLRRVLASRADGLFTVLLRLREYRDATGASILHLLEALGERYDPVELHRLRRLSRRLRYTAELAEALRAQPVDASARLKALQDALGHIRDTYVLAEWLRRQAETSQARGQVELAAEASAQAVSFQEESYAHHRAFLARDPREEVQRALAAMGQERPAA